MVYVRRVVKRRPASLTEEEWLQLVNHPPVWPPRGDVAFCTPRPAVSDWHVLCPWCRERHLASEVDPCMALPTKRAPIGNSTSSTSSVSAGELLRPFSEVWAFLSATAYPNGMKRRTGRLSVSCESQGLRLSCQDEETGLYVSLTANTLDDLLLAFEVGLAGGDLPWRESKYAKGKR